MSTDTLKYLNPKLDALVDEACAEMKSKLLKKEMEGEKNWDDKDFLQHYEKQAMKKLLDGKHIDAMNYMMMVWNMDGKPLA